MAVRRGATARERRRTRRARATERCFESAAKYDGYNTRTEWHTAELAALVAAGAIPRRGRALDLGCGHGSEAIFLATMGWNVIGIDRERDAIAAAQARADHALTRSARARTEFRCRNALTFVDPDPFDLVVERLLFQNLPSAQRRRFIETVASVLKLETGLLVMRTNSADDDRIRADAAWGRVSGARSSYTKPDENLLRRYFTVGPEVGFTGLVTDPTQATHALIVTTAPLAIRVMRRNARVLVKRRSRRAH